MDVTKAWTVILETPSGLEQLMLVRYPRRPTKDLAAGLVRLQLGMPVTLPESYRDCEDPSLQALEDCGYRLLWIGDTTEKNAAT